MRLTVIEVMVKKTCYFISIIYIIFFIGCKKDDDSNLTDEDPCKTVDLGVFFVEETSISKSIPYKTDENLVFTDSLNNEVIFEFTLFEKEDWQDGFTAYACETDPTILKKYEKRIQYFSYLLKDSKNEINFILSLHLAKDVTYTNKVLQSDVLSVGAISKFGPPKVHDMRILVDQGTNHDIYTQNSHQPVPSVKLFNRTFNNVYISRSVYYSYSRGIIAFRDSDQKLWLIK